VKEANWPAGVLVGRGHAGILAASWRVGRRVSNERQTKMGSTRYESPHLGQNVDAINRGSWKTPGRIRLGFIALNLLTVALTYVAYDRTDSCTWTMGEASWKLTLTQWAKRDQEIDPDKVTEFDTSDDSLARLRERARYWLFWQRAWKNATSAVAGASLIVFAFRRDVPSFVACFICSFLAFKSFGLTRIRF
jgi:hypothetical protein